ncbi:MAG: tetratricopeptide repeat protein [Myxococcaceae bacterium]
MIRFLTGRPVTAAVLAALMLAMPLCLGGTARATLPLLVLLSGTALVLSAVASLRRGHTLCLPLPAWMLGLCSLITLFQLIPLPPFLLAWLSPPAAELRAFNLIPLGLTGWRPLSLDAPATWRELAKSLSYLAALLAAAQLARSRDWRPVILGAVVLAAVVTALIGYGHALFRLHSLFGRFVFTDARPPFLTVFGNPNHAAAFMAAGSMLALGVGLDCRERRHALAWWGAALVAGVAVVLTLSRGGILFWLVGQGLFVLLMLRGRRKQRDESLEPLPVKLTPDWVVVGLMGALALGGFMAYEELLREARADHSKVELWPMMFRAGMQFAPAGMGRGAYESAFSRFQSRDPYTLYTHSENVVLQLLSEVGLPVAAGLLTLAMLWFRRILRRRRESAVDAAVISVVVATVLHDFFDFSLELPPMAVALCLAIGVLERPGSGQGGGRWSLEPATFLKLSPLLPAAALLAVLLGRSTLAASEAAVAQALREQDPPAELMEVVKQEVDRHFADYLLYSLGGSGFAVSDPLRALAFLNRALFLRPLDGDAHYAAARALYRLQKRGQAFLEYGLAYAAMRRWKHTDELLDEAVARARGEELRKLVPNAEVDGVSNVLRRLQAAGRTEELAQLLAWALETDAEDPRVFELWAWEAHARRAKGDLQGALRAITSAEGSSEGEARVAVLKAQTLLQLGRYQEGVNTLEEMSARQPGNIEVAFQLAELLTRAKKPARARAVLNRTRPFLQSPSHRQQTFWLEASTYRQEGRYSQARKALESAHQLAPRAAEIHFALAEMEEQLGRFAEAISSVRKGMELDPKGDAQAKLAWISRLQEAFDRPAKQAPPPSATEGLE